jgi:hypothetical protein
LLVTDQLPIDAINGIAARAMIAARPVCRFTKLEFWRRSKAAV